MSAQEQIMQKRLVEAANTMSSMLSRRAREIQNKQREKIKQYYRLPFSLSFSFIFAHDCIFFSDLHEQRNKSGLDKVKEQMYKFYLEKLTEEEGEQMKNVNIQIYEDELRELRSKGLVDGFFVFVSVFSGAICMMFIEGWKFEDSLYWACVTATTVGYGDVTPDSESGKIFTIFYTIVACSLAAKGFGDIVRYPLVMREKENELRITEQFGEEITEHTLKCILHNKFFDRIPNLRKDDKQLVKSEFVLLLLQMMDKVQDKDVILASQIFDRLDSAADGVLDEADQQEQLRKARERDQVRALERERREQELLLQEQAQGTGAFGAGLGSLVNALNPVNIMNIPGFSPSTRSRAESGGRRRKYSAPTQQQSFQEDDEESHVFHDAVTNPMIVEQREAALGRSNSPNKNRRSSKIKEQAVRDDFDDEDVL